LDISEAQFNRRKNRGYLMEIRPGQKWRIKNAIRPNLIVIRVSPYSKQVDWNYESEEKRVYQSHIDFFGREYEIVEDV